MPDRLAWVHVTAPVVHVNGDRAQYLDHVFVLSWEAGEPYPADDESTDARWFPLDALPPMPTHLLTRITVALDAGTRTRFDWSGGP